MKKTECYPECELRACFFPSGTTLKEERSRSFARFGLRLVRDCRAKCCTSVILLPMETIPRTPYETDLTDKTGYPATHPPTHPLRQSNQNMRTYPPLHAITNAILSIRKTGCPWRNLPHDLSTNIQVDAGDKPKLGLSTHSNMHSRKVWETQVATVVGWVKFLDWREWLRAIGW
jgi:transposase